MFKTNPFNISQGRLLRNVTSAFLSFKKTTITFTCLIRPKQTKRKAQHETQGTYIILYLGLHGVPFTKVHNEG